MRSILDTKLGSGIGSSFARHTASASLILWLGCLACQRSEVLRARAGSSAVLEVPSTASMHDIQLWADALSDSTNGRPIRVSCSRATPTTVGAECGYRAGPQPVKGLSVLLEATDAGVGYRVFAVSPRISGDAVAPLLSAEELRKAIRDLHLRFPAQEVAWLIVPREAPDDLQAVCRALTIVSEEFPRTVLSGL